MHEVLFHGKRKDNGEWVYCNIYGELCTAKGRRTRLIRKTPYGEKYYYYIHELKQLIDTETVGQFTGLTDKNGKKIFEGDIVKTNKYGAEHGDGRNFSGFDIFVIGFENGYNLYNKWRRFNLRLDTGIEVIGNIHDNPELMKGGDDNG